MNLFGKRNQPQAPAPKGPSITEADKDWVENVFKWILSNFGYPSGKTIQIVFSEQYFPQTYKNKVFKVESLIADLCGLLKLDEKRISFEMEKDIRDLSFTPIVVYGEAFYSDLEIIKSADEDTRYVLHIANNLLEYPDRLLVRTILEMIKIKVSENNYNFKEQSDTPLFIYFVCIYFGFGLIIASKLYDIRVEYIAGWQKNSKYISPMPFQVMAYALAVFARLEKNDNPEWRLKLSQEMSVQFDLAMDYIKNESKSYLFDEEKFRNELKASVIIKQAYSLYKENKFEKAIEEYLKALPLVQNSKTLASIYLNLGYYSLRLKLYELSIPYFIKSLEFKTDIEQTTTYAYSLDNLGFAYIMSGKLEEGKRSVESAMKTEKDDLGYSFRNLAIYHMKKNEMEKSEEYFQKAFNLNTKVDLLEYYYAQFQFQKGNKSEGMRYLEMAVAKGEPEAIELIKEFSLDN